MRVGQGHHERAVEMLLPSITVLVAAILAGCTLIVDADSPQCVSNADCVARGPGFADAVCERRACVVPVIAAERGLACTAPSSSGLPTVNYSFAIQLATSGRPGAATSFRVQACQQL